MTLPVALTGSTRVVAVIGDPIRHSLSPVIHNAAFRACGLDYVYVAFAIRNGDVGGALEAVRALDIRGLSVTMPYKTDVARLADVRSDAVTLLSSANTIVNDDSILRADSTDGAGCIDALRESGCDVSGKRCMVLGAGGAGRAVSYALAVHGAAEVVVVNRDDDRAQSAIALAGPRSRRGAATEARDMDVIINATPQGMGDDASLPLDRSDLRPGQFVNDLVYHPLHTPLLRAAVAAGAQPVDGLGMLIHQAARQFRAWTGVDAPTPVMRDAALQTLANRTIS